MAEVVSVNVEPGDIRIIGGLSNPAAVYRRPAVSEEEGLRVAAQGVEPLRGDMHLCQNAAEAVVEDAPFGLELDVERGLLLGMPLPAAAVLPYPILGQPPAHDGDLHERESLV